MNCTDIAALSPLYLLGELDVSRAAAFQAHVESCRACAREMRQQTEFDSRLRAQADAADREIDTAALDHAILRRIAAEEGRRLPARWLIAAGVTAVLIASTLAYRVWHVPQVSAVCDDAARDHHHEVIDRQPRAWLSDHAQIEELAQRQGLPASAVVSLAASGYRMERGKLCRLTVRSSCSGVYGRGAGVFGFPAAKGRQTGCRRVHSRPRCRSSGVVPDRAAGGHRGYGSIGGSSLTSGSFGRRSPVISKGYVI